MTRDKYIFWGCVCAGAGTCLGLVFVKAVPHSDTLVFSQSMWSRDNMNKLSHDVLSHPEFGTGS